MPETSSQARALTESFHRHLDAHGYGFQYRVLGEVLAMASAGTSAWRLQGSELPVRVGGGDTRIDFVLRHATEPVYIICECKRAYPRLADWCFAKMPFVTDRSESVRPLIVERWSRSSDAVGEALDTQAGALSPLPDSY